MTERSHDSPVKSHGFVLLDYQWSHHWITRDQKEGCFGGLRGVQLVMAWATGCIPKSDPTVYILRPMAHTAITVFMEPPPSCTNTPWRLGHGGTDVINVEAVSVAHAFAWTGDEAAKLSDIVMVHPCSCHVIRETALSAS